MSVHPSATNDAHELELESFNLLKRPQLSDLTMNDFKFLTGKQLENVILQSKLTAELRDIKGNLNRGHDSEEEEEIDDPFELEDFNPESKD